LQDVANEKDGFNKIMKLSLEVLMKSERKLHQERCETRQLRTKVLKSVLLIVSNMQMHQKQVFK